jgi:anti-anti-sigma factor
VFASPCDQVLSKSKSQDYAPSLVMYLSAYLSCNRRQFENGLIVEFIGEMDFAAVPGVRKLLKQLLQEEISLLVVDLSQVTFLNTPMWAALQCYQLDAQPRLRLVLCGMSEALRSAFDINIGDSSGIAVSDTVERALSLVQTR